MKLATRLKQEADKYQRKFYPYKNSSRFRRIIDAINDHYLCIVTKASNIAVSNGRYGSVYQKIWIKNSFTAKVGYNCRDYRIAKRRIVRKLKDEGFFVEETFKEIKVSWK